ncbi:YjgN family protein [Defluviimonas salinarum]|uniref:YjgN family protein n=1 Tax=Defluviimonas salinarum TaxID=2992147 RepID=A0ABT3IYR4_9RHOB|nr:YjgN family protein [Defluviimonas salinarum]MCW3780563.1 YjgN family protein [Defluviimonas salinarum]
MSFNDRLTASYSGGRGPLFGLAFRTALLTLLTLGIYRFWAKTRIRKYIWSSIRLGGDTLEYTGTGLEKFLGFLVAVVVLAVYLGLVQLVLFYFGLHFVVEPQTEAEILMQMSVFYLSFFALVPLMLFARYRARRYMLARTRFRGIRFGMDKAAWGYVWRAIGHGILTFLSLGLLLPRQTFWLEKYKTDRSHYGDTRFVQGGKWTALYPAMRGYFLGFALLVASIVYIAMSRLGSADRIAVAQFLPLGLLAVFGFGFVYYRVHSFRYLTAQKTLAGAVGFLALPRTGRVLGIYIVGALVVGLIVSFIFGVIGGVFAVSVAAAENGATPGAGSIVIIAALYLVALAMLGALALVFIIQPVIAHFTETMTVLNPAALDAVRQRAHDAGADAEGFADALDLGAAV